MKILQFAIPIVTAALLTGCSTAQPPAAVQSETRPTETPREKTETDDSTRPTKGEEIDLGLEGGSSGDIVVEDSGAGIPEENPESTESEPTGSEPAESDPTGSEPVESEPEDGAERKCTNDPDDKSGRPKCGDVDGSDVEIIE